MGKYILAVQIGVMISMVYVFILLHQAMNKTKDSDLKASLYSLAFGFHTTVLIFLFVLGVMPFSQGEHASMPILIASCLLCSICFFGKAEITGNILLDAVVIGSGLTLASGIISAGLLNLFHNFNAVSLFWPWFFLSLGVSIIFRISFWVNK